MAEIEIVRMSGDWSKSLPGYRAKCLAWCRAAKAKGAVSVVLADDAFVQELNRDYRGKNKPTNVLSFPNEEGGDIILAYETVKREAKEQKKTFAQHMAHLVVHGCLHLAGHDHEDDKEADAMEALEAKILAKLGYPNPYLAA